MIYTRLRGQCFDKLSLNAAGCRTADSKESVRTSIDSEVRELKLIRNKQELKMHRKP